MRAEIVSVGTELLLGQITDTNATFLAQSLADLGIDLFFVSQVGDNRGRLVDTLRRGWERSDLVITTGGVGPTEDDLTREAIADLVGETPTVDEATVETIRAFFRNRNAEMPERNRKQAWLIPSAQALPNPVGTAPGWFVQREGKIIVAMPGVPREMKRMWEREAIPRLGAYLPETVLLTRNIRTIGIGESSVEEVLGDLVHGTNPTVATYAKDDGVHVRITAKARTSQEAAALLKPVVAEAERILGDHIYGYDNDALPEAVLSLAIVHKSSRRAWPRSSPRANSVIATNWPSSRQRASQTRCRWAHSLLFSQTFVGSQPDVLTSAKCPALWSTVSIGPQPLAINKRTNSIHRHRPLSLMACRIPWRPRLEVGAFSPVQLIISAVPNTTNPG